MLILIKYFHDLKILFLNDLTLRVGREPLRKLSYNDRLIKPLRGTLEYGTPNNNILIGILSGLSYINKKCDEDSCFDIKLELKDNPQQAIEKITNLINNPIEQEFCQKIVSSFKNY